MSSKASTRGGVSAGASGLLRGPPRRLQRSCAIVELFEAYDVWDFGRPDPGREHLEADWVAPGFDPAADSWLVTEEGGGVVYEKLLGDKLDASA